MKKKTNDTVRASALQIALALALLLSSASLLALACFGQSPSATPTPMECGKIAFHKAVNGIFRIFVMRPDGSGVTDLTDGFLPAFSRDGNKIAFIRLHDIWIMNADGSNQAQVTSGIPLSDLALSSDGSKIVFARYVNVNGTTTRYIFVVKADGSNLTQLTSGSVNDYTPEFSPDGTRIVFSRELEPIDGIAHIYVMNADGSGLTQLTSGSSSEEAPSYSPDGSKITFTYFFGPSHIYIMNADGSGRTQLTFGSGSEEGSSFGPDTGEGGRIAYYDDTDSTIHVMNADGSGQHSVGPFAGQGPSFGGCPNPVIFIHGVAGSVLVDGPPGGDELWLGPLSNRRRLGLDPMGSPTPSPNIKAVDVMRCVRIGGVCVEHVYDLLLDFLTDPQHGGYHEYQLVPNDPQICDTSQINPDPTLNPNLFEFVYDWRQELGSTAQQLRQFVQCVKQFHPGSKINILTHSMGSLLARRYILDNPTDHNVDRLITIGAPWLGAPKLLYALESGNFIDDPVPIAAGPDISYILQSIRAAHELLPSSSYQALGGASILVEEGYDYDGNGLDHESYDHARVVNFLNTKYPSTTPGTTADLFHSYTTSNGAQDDWRSDTSGVKYFHFYGVQSVNQTIAETVARKELVCGPNPFSSCNVMDVLEPRYSAGDGTVPTISASRRTGSGNLNAPNAQLFRMTNSSDDLVEHTGLTQNPDVQSRVLTLLQGGTAPPFPSANGPAGDNSPEPSYYVSILGGASIVVSDTHGNSTAPLLGDVLGMVPGVETFHMGDNAERIALPVSNSEAYQIAFNSTSAPIAIKIVKGADDVTPTDVIRYQDLAIPAEAVATLDVTTEGVQSLTYTLGGNTTTVEPSLVVSGDTARDITPPILSFTEVPNQGMTEVTVAASDTESGVNDVKYSTDGTTFQLYTGPLLLNATETPVLHAFATDNAGNRSSPITYNLNSPPITVSGFTKDEDGNPIADVRIHLSGSQSADTQTDAAGHYSLSNLATGGNYVLIATRTGFTFSPSSQPINNPAMDVVVDFTATPAPIAVSRKTHGTAGDFDIELPLSGTPAIECRSGGTTNDHQIVIVFPNAVVVNGNPQAQVTSGTGTVGSGGVSNGGTVTVNGNTVTIPLTNVASAQTINVTLFGVDDGSFMGDVVIPMGVLAGDTNGNATVNAADVSQTKARLGQSVDATNFRSDVNANGVINSADVAIVKSHLGEGLP